MTSEQKTATLLIDEAKGASACFALALGLGKPDIFTLPISVSELKGVTDHDKAAEVAQIIVNELHELVSEGFTIFRVAMDTGFALSDPACWCIIAKEAIESAQQTEDWQQLVAEFQWVGPLAGNACPIGFRDFAAAS